MKLLFSFQVKLSFLLLICIIELACEHQAPISSEPIVEKLQVSPDSAFTVPNSTFVFRADAFNSSGMLVNRTSVLWISSNIEVASIDQLGVATCKKIGRTEITASVNGIVSNISFLNVIDPEIQVGQRDGVGVSYTQFGEGQQIGGCGYSEFNIDANNDDLVDFILKQDITCLNNRANVYSLTPLGRNQLVFNKPYKSIADSILLSDLGSAETISGFVWADTAAFNSKVDSTLNWTSDRTVLFFHIGQDATEYLRNLGFWLGGTTRFTPLKLYNTGETTYGWIRLKHDTRRRTLILEYASKKSSRQ